MLVLIAPVAWKGFNDGSDRVQPLDLARPGMAASRQALAAPTTEILQHRRHPTGRFFTEVILLAGLAHAARHLERDELAHWLWETWRFVKQISPLIAGVFVGRDVPRDHARRMGRAVGWAEYHLGQPDRRDFRHFHVLPHPGRSADGRRLSGPGNASRAAAGLPAGRPGTQLAKHPGDRQDHGLRQDSHVRQSRGGVQHHGGLSVFGIALAAF